MTTNENTSRTETPLTLSEYLRAGTAHAACTHPMTKAGRAWCRREKIKSNTDTIVNHTIVFVRRARSEGHANLISQMTPWEIAQEHGYDTKDWNYKLAERLIRERCKAMDETHLLAPDMI